MSTAQKLIFDIETVGVDFESLDAVSRDYIKKYAETEEEFEEAKDRLSFSPLTGQIVSIGVLNPDTNKGVIYIVAEEKLPAQLKEGTRLRQARLPPACRQAGNGQGFGGQVSIETGSEKEILEKFWEIAGHYNYFITFNGRTFDVPFLLIRSAILDVKPAKNLMANRYLESQPYSAAHIDILDQLTFYGAVRKKFNLHFWSKAFGIKSPKEQGITGDDVKRLYQEKKFLELAEYNLGDLLATKALFEKWEKYIKF